MKELEEMSRKIELLENRVRRLERKLLRPVTNQRPRNPQEFKTSPYSKTGRCGLKRKPDTRECWDW